jgi:hypothetical protein
VLGAQEAYRNRINGTIDVLAPLRGLTQLLLNGGDKQRLTGNVSSITALSKLQYLSIGQNSFFGILDALTVMTALTMLRVSENLFEGTVPRALQSIQSRCPKNLGCVEFWPQRLLCSSPHYKRVGYEDQLSFGTCVPRLEPTFTAYEARRELGITVRKITHLSYTSTSLAVLAANVGDGDTTGAPQEVWRVNGLTPNASEATPTIRCGSASRCVFPGPCQTIWLSSPNCAVFNDTHLQVLQEGSYFDVAAVVLTLRASSSSLPDGQYQFNLQLPVTDAVSWMYTSLNGSLNVKAVASAMHSELSFWNIETATKAVRSESQFCDNALFGCLTISDMVLETTSQGNRRVEVDIVAKDCDGFELNRTGEEIYLSVDLPDGTKLSVLVPYDPVFGAYRTVLGSFSLLGIHTISMKTDPTTVAVPKARFKLACANGYTDEGGVACVRQASDVRRIVAYVLATLMLGAVGYALWFVKKRPGRAYAIVVTILHGEFLLALGFSLEVLDLVSDSMMFSAVMSSGDENVEALQIPFGIFFGTCALASVLNTGMTVRLYLKQRAQRQRDLLLDVDELSETDAAVLALEQQLVSAGRDLTKAYVAILMCFLEDIPLGILGTLLIHRQVPHPTPMQLVSILTSALMIGLK